MEKSGWLADSFPKHFVNADSHKFTFLLVVGGSEDRRMAVYGLVYCSG